eukprot:SAG31_NODE_9625_length_1249_cov_1.373913_1_plen_236_part_01
MAKKVSYFYDPDIGNFYCGPKCPMKPHRLRMTHHLVAAYGLHHHMEVLRPCKLDRAMLKSWHDEAYIDYLGKHSLGQAVRTGTLTDEDRSFNLRDDVESPTFDGVFDYSQLCAGGSIGAAQKICDGVADIAINWAGGLHHAKKGGAAGFCYVNDAVLAINELLRKTEDGRRKKYTRVAYIDIDLHHGDGVEQAFSRFPNVMTVSFHKYDGKFYPGTGGPEDCFPGRSSDQVAAINF